MTDEPTGALDSNTGKQVFDTLKKLSRDKLVLVVSHDREFAEQYADRIIELKDGKILSDVTKSCEQQKELTENVNLLGDMLCIKEGSQLSEADFEHIKRFLSSSKGDAIIAGGEKDVKNFKRASRINDSGEKEVFVDTDREHRINKTYTPEQSRFIRSKLPMRHAVKIGVSSLKSKPIRLIFTTLLCVVSFVLFGVLSTINFYNSETTFKQTMINSGHDFVVFGKEYKVSQYYYLNGKLERESTDEEGAAFSNDDIELLKEQYGDSVFSGVMADLTYSVRSSAGDYWVNNFSCAAYIPEDNPLRETIQGSYPESSNEICISSYAAEVIFNCKIRTSTDEEVEINSKDDVIEKTIMCSDGYQRKIVGIIDSGAPDSKYDVLKTENNHQLKKDFELALGDGLHKVVFMTEDGVLNMAGRFNSSQDNGRYYRSISTSTVHEDEEFSFPDSAGNYYEKLASNHEVMYFTDGKSSVGEDEALISSSMFLSYAENVLYDLYDKAMGEESQEYNRLHSLAYNTRLGCEKEYDEESGQWVVTHYMTSEEIIRNMKEIAEALDDIDAYRIGVILYNEGTAMGKLKEYKAGGVYICDADDYSEERTILLNEEAYDALWDEQRAGLSHCYESITKYVQDKDAKYTAIFVPYDHSQEKTDALWSVYSSEFSEEDCRFTLDGGYISALQQADYFIKEIGQIFMYIGLVLAAFAILLFSNFISVSISQKSREIGILRAVGARSNDVFKIFFSESFCIAIICVIISTVGNIVLCGILNTEIASMLGAAIFNFGIPSFLIVVAIALLTAVVATFIPVWKAARKKPVDSIKAI